MPVFAVKSNKSAIELEHIRDTFKFNLKTWGCDEFTC